jgi:hypothetical protein
VEQYEGEGVVAGMLWPGLQSALGLISCRVRKPWLQRRVILDGVSEL